MYTIQLYRNEIEEYDDRYIIVDENGYDVCGEHYSLEDAEMLCKSMNEDETEH